MKSGQLKRTRLKRKVNKKQPLDGSLRGGVLPIVNHAMFREAARKQGRCAVTGKGGTQFDPHHVVYEQHLKGMHLPIYDTRNALRVMPDAHQRHHKGFRRIKTRELTDDNIAYAFQIMGPAAYDYIIRRYDNREPDPRLESHLAACTPV